MNINYLQTGIVYMASELLPISKYSDGYDVGAMVAPDGEEWLKVKFPDGYFGYKRDANIIEGKDVHGNNHYLHYTRSNYIKATDDDGNNHYFLDEESARAFEFYFSIHLNRYYDKKSNRFFGSATTLSYHDSRCGSVENRVPSFVNEGDEYVVGIEVEKVDSALRNKGLAFEILHETGWKKEDDSSLNAGGYELVSPKLPLLDIRRIEKACAPVREYIDGNSDSSCGGHFHISRKNTSGKELLRSMKGFAPIIYALYENRLTNRFCQAKKWGDYERYPEKYSAFHMKSDRVEIRVFGRITNYATMLWRVKLMQLLLGDSGKNLNQFLLKMSSKESKLYNLLREQYTHNGVKNKIRLIGELSERYSCGTISNSIRKKINNRFGEDVLPIS